MLETVRAVAKDEWIVCPKCGHKLGRKVGKKMPTGIEIKCHSCKTLCLITNEKPKQYKVPHCEHCKYYHGCTKHCILMLRHVKRFGVTGKAQGFRNCQKFEPLEEYKENYRRKSV